MLVSETAHQDDKTSEPLGPNPLGSFMFDQGGRFILLIARPDIPKFAANKRDAGTPEENKAVLAGLLAFIGTYIARDQLGLDTLLQHSAKERQETLRYPGASRAATDDRGALAYPN
jgi:hypothetical protein